MSQQDKTCKLFSRKEVATRWGVSEETIKRYEKKGLLISLRFSSRLVRYREDDLLAFERNVGKSGKGVKSEG